MSIITHDHELNRIGAWASDQSSELQNREELENKVNEYQKKFKGKKIFTSSFLVWL